MPANLENSAVAQDWKRSVFIPIPKKGNARECSNYHITALISQTSKVTLKILLARFQQCMNRELQMFKLDLEKAEEPEIKLPTSIGLLQKQKNSRRTSISALLVIPKPLTVWITTNWKILQEMGIPDHLTCLLRNLYAGQEATVRNGHGTAIGSKLGKEYFKAVYCHPAYLTSMQSTSCEMQGSMKHKLKLRLLGEISITPGMQMTPPLWQKAKRN